MLKRTVAWDGFFAHCILSRIERKDLKFFSCCANIYWARARFNSFSAYGEYAEWYFPVGQAKIFNCILFSWGSYIICSHPWLKYWPYGVLSILDTIKPSHATVPLKGPGSCYSPSMYRWNLSNIDFSEFFKLFLPCTEARQYLLLWTRLC